jgi:Na+-transporting methylmalonyl-CoA/oxaloacetate decarboxylase beta subunit
MPASLARESMAILIISVIALVIAGAGGLLIAKCRRQIITPEPHQQLEGMLKAMFNEPEKK